jgi:hypothetical protein
MLRLSDSMIHIIMIIITYNSYHHHNQMSQTRESQLLLQTTSIMKRLKGKLNMLSNSITLQLMIHCVLFIEDN